MKEWHAKREVVAAALLSLCLGVLLALPQAPAADAAGTLTLTVNTTIGNALSILGALSKGSGTFVIDHPLDPVNKLLYHSFVESPDVMNIYDGVAELDSGGSVTVSLPSYFLALNKDFRYLTTPMGQAMPGLYISSEVHKWFFGLLGTPVFTIAGGAPGGKVSWQVTGIRHDIYIEERPIIPEVDKGPNQLVDKGKFISPELYNADGTLK